MTAPEARVAVIGAGLAGLAAAFELGRRGLPAVILERSQHAGGRARSAVSEGFVLEPLSPVVSSADAALLGWIAAAGAAGELLPMRPAFPAQARHGKLSEVAPRRLLELARIPGVRPHEALRLLRLPRLLRRYARCLDPEAPETGAPLDDRSLADFARLYFGRGVLDYWMAPFITSAAPGDEEATSRVLFLRRVAAQFGASRGLLRAPLAELVAAVSARLSILFGAELSALEPGRDGGLTLHYTRGGQARQLEVRAAVLATPAPPAARLAAPILTTGERELLAQVRYADAVTLCVGACRPLSFHALEIRVPHAEGSPLETALLEPGQPGGRVPDGYGLAALHGTAAWSERALELPESKAADALLGALDALQPGSRAAVSFTRLFRTAGARPRFDVGHFRALERLARIEAERRREGRRLYLAGDWRADPSWNGAVASGLRAARAAAQDLGA
jgi:protoporphyrinogen oxidase